MSKIEPGDVIKHKAFIDVCVQVTMVGKNPDTGDLTITGFWFNLGQNQSFQIKTKQYPQGIVCNFDISKKNLDKWFKCEEPTAKFLREAAWTSVA